MELREEREVPAVLEVGAGCPPGLFHPHFSPEGVGVYGGPGFPHRERDGRETWGVPVPGDSLCRFLECYNLAVCLDYE